MTAASAVGRRVLLASPRSFCAGVERAIATVEKALELYGPPVYVRRQIVHNSFVVEALENRGAVFVNDIEQVPDEAVVIFSAHGVAPAVRAQAMARSLRTIDATCPLVTKVHHEARRLAAAGFEILLLGQEGHDEVVGIVGEAPDHVRVVDGPDQVDALEVRDVSKVAVADHARGRRDKGHGWPAGRAISRAGWPTQRRHLLCGAKPAECGEGDGGRG